MDQTMVIGVSIILFAVFSTIFNIAILIITLSIKRQIKQTTQQIPTTKLEQSIGVVPPVEEVKVIKEPQKETALEKLKKRKDVVARKKQQDIIAAKIKELDEQKAQLIAAQDNE